MKSDFPCHRFMYSLLLLVSAVQLLPAQYAEENFIRYTVNEGLSDNNVTCIQQDDWGFVWVGTEIGLNRFDGYQFQNYDQGSPERFLSSSNIRKLITLDRQRLAIVTSNGFHVLNTNDFAIQHYLIPDSSAFVTIRNRVWDLKELKDGSVGVTTSSGFYVFHQDGSLIFRHDAYGLKDIGNKRIFYGRNIFSLPGNEMLIYVQERGLAHFDIDKRVYQAVPDATPGWKTFIHPTDAEGGPWLSKAQISDHTYIFLPRKDSLIYVDYKQQKRVASLMPFNCNNEFSWESNVTMLDDSTFAINGRYTGFYLFQLDRRTGNIRCHPEKYLGSLKINSLFQDKDHRLWAGTTQGLLQQKVNEKFIRKHHWAVDDFSNMGYVDGLMLGDKLYLGRHSRDAGLIIIDTQTMAITSQIHFYGKGNGWNEIFSVQMYHPDTLWLGSYNGLLWFDIHTHEYGKVTEQQDLPPEMEGMLVLKPVHQDGYAWMVRWLNGVVARYHISTRKFEIFTADTKPALPFNEVKDIVYDAYGDLWVSGHSLARWNTRENYFDTLITVYGGIQKYNDDIVVIAADASGSLWLHNAENGLLEYRIKARQFVSYGMKDGLPSDVLRCFSPIVDGILWIGSHNHLTRFDTRTKKMDVFGYQDGLPQRKPISRRMILSADGTQCFMFYQDEVIQFPIHPMHHRDLSSDLMVHNVVVNNHQSFSFPGSTLKLKPGDNNISVFYTIVDFEGGHNYQFAYKLNDADAWNSLGQQRHINLSNLSSGTYTLQLSATGKSGEQKVKTFAFVIAPPFWMKGWFILLCMVVLLALVYSFYKWRIAQIRKRADLDKLLSQTEMKALHAQMNPHFIFNSLNSIREMILNNENHEASRFLSKFAHLIRITLDQSRQQVISLRNSMDYINRYVEMEKIRNSRFHFAMQADPDLELDETILPPMLIQPFIENAIWHGTNGDGKMIEIKVDFAKQGERLVCTIEDNGVGIDHSLKSKINGDQHQSVGIANIKNRIDLLNQKYGMKSSITVKDKSEPGNRALSGTLVTITLPLEMTEV